MKPTSRNVAQTFLSAYPERFRGWAQAFQPALRMTHPPGWISRTRKADKNVCGQPRKLSGYTDWKVCATAAGRDIPTPARNDPQLPRATAFTLIELLVVISILGILAALLLPTLSKAKSQGAKTIDINNLKQIITAVQLYVADNSDILPAPNWKTADYSGNPGWLYTLDPAAAGPAQFKLQKGLFWPTLGNPRLYLCPMDNTNNAFFKQREQQLSSYAMNGAVVGFDRTNYPAAKLSRMRPQDVAFWETDETDPTFFNDGANFPQEGVSARHQNGAINAAFGGAVGYIRLGAWYLQVYETNKNNLWCYPGSDDGR